MITQDHTNHTTTQDTAAKEIAGLLDTRAQQLSMRTLQTLEQGRNRAVNAHANALAGHQVNTDGSLASWLHWSAHPRAMSAGLLCAALVVGLTLSQSFNQHHENSDAFLLGAELPPEAFVDRGFEPWLNAKLELPSSQ